MVLRDAVYLVEATGRCVCLVEATGRCGVPRGGNGEMRRASWRQRDGAACLVEATGRCGVPRGGNKEMRRASWRQQGDAACLVEATGRYGVPRGGNREMWRASWRQQVDAACLVEAAGGTRCALGRQRGEVMCLGKATWGERPPSAYATSRRLPRVSLLIPVSLVSRTKINLIWRSDLTQSLYSLVHSLRSSVFFLSTSGFSDYSVFCLIFSAF